MLIYLVFLLGIKTHLYLLGNTTTCHSAVSEEDQSLLDALLLSQVCNLHESYLFVFVLQTSVTQPGGCDLAVGRSFVERSAEV